MSETSNVDAKAAPLPAPAKSWLPLILIGVVAAIGAVVFLARPELDLVAGGYFYRGAGRFIGGELRWVDWLRNLFIVFFWACVLLAIVGMVRTRKGQGPWLGFAFPHWLFLGICLGVGPGLVANVILKDQWGRARPKHVVEFGGSKPFTPPILFSKACPRNCSFVSGEASATYLPFFAAAALMPQNAAVLVVAGSVMGLVSGAVRMAQGGHFLSDVIFAGVFMALTVLVVRWLMFGPDLLAWLRRRAPALSARLQRSPTR